MTPINELYETKGDGDLFNWLNGGCPPIWGVYKWGYPLPPRIPPPYMTF